MCTETKWQNKLWVYLCCFLKPGLEFSIAEVLQANIHEEVWSLRGGHVHVLNEQWETSEKVLNPLQCSSLWLLKGAKVKKQKSKERSQRKEIKTLKVKQMQRDGCSNGRSRLFKLKLLGSDLWIMTEAMRQAALSLNHHSQNCPKLSSFICLWSECLSCLLMGSDT